MQFEMRHRPEFRMPSEPVRFSEKDAPDWLTSAHTIPGSTLDMRWFWNKHVLTLQVGGSIDTDFRTITRTA
jgi:hypothetical protein